MTKAVVGIFDKDKNIEDVSRELYRHGFVSKDISDLMRNRLDEIEFIGKREDNVVEGLLTLGGIGAVLGGLAGLFANLLSPDLGAFFIGVPIAVLLGLSGLIASVVSGIFTGVLIGGFLGAVMGYLVSGENAQLYEQEIKKDSLFLAVPIKDLEEEIVKELLQHNGAVFIRTGNAEYLLGEDKIAYDEPYKWYPNHEGSPFVVAGVKGGKSKEKGESENKKK